MPLSSVAHTRLQAVDGLMPGEPPLASFAGQPVWGAGNDRSHPEASVKTRPRLPGRLQRKADQRDRADGGAAFEFAGFA